MKVFILTKNKRNVNRNPFSRIKSFYREVCDRIAQMHYSFKHVVKPVLRLELEVVFSIAA